jgi:hypothetical protein
MLSLEFITSIPFAILPSTAEIGDHTLNYKKLQMNLRYYCKKFLKKYGFGSVIRA